MKKMRMKKIVVVFLSVILCAVPTSIYATEKKGIAVEYEDKISERLYEEFNRLETAGVDLAITKIPVWVWYEDIDQKQVNREVTEQTGLTQEHLSIDFEMPTPSLINDLQSEKIGSQERMKEYLERTFVARKLEKQRTEIYITKRRELSKRKYTVANTNRLKNMKIKDKDLMFFSQFSPCLIINMTKMEIENAKKNANITKIDFFSEQMPVPDTESSVLESSSINQVRMNLGLTGKDVKVGLIDNGLPAASVNLNSDKIFAVNITNTYDHATRMALTIMGRNGVAPEAELYCTSYSLFNIESLISKGVSVINMSLKLGSNTTYKSLEKWFDHIAATHNISFTKSSGNTGADGAISSPGLADNLITVGAYDDKDTGVSTDDTYNGITNFKDYNICKKPDILAPSNLPGGGTSNSAAHAAGIAALLLELKPSLAYQPQTLKAILMASCQRKVKSVAGVAAETMAQGLTERQGAGAVDAWNAVCIAAQGNYGYGEVTSATEKRNFIQPSYGASHMNVSIAWLRENTVSSSNHASGAVTAGTQHDLDLSVYRNGTLVGSSANANSSTEMAYFPLSASEARYQIRVSKEDLTNLETVRYGYAYSTDNMAFRENLTGTGYPEGIYYIRGNANASGAYLTVDEQTGQISQKAFTGAANQQWVSSKKGYDPFTIQTNSSAYPGYLSISGQTSAWVRQDSAQYITYGGNGFDNTYGIQLYGLPASNSRSLTALDTSVQSSTAIWQNIGIPERFQWYFEPVGYIRGDVNRDGTVSNADALLAQNYVNKLVNLDAAQKFLGDMNNDGQVNINDVNLIQQAVSAG